MVFIEDFKLITCWGSPGESSSPTPPFTLVVPSIIRVPRNDIIAIRCHRYSRVSLWVTSVSVYLELPFKGCSVGIVTLSINSPAATILVMALPGNDEPAISGHRDIRMELLVGSVCVDLELVAILRPVRVVSLCKDSPVIAVLIEALPGNDITSVRTHRNS